MTGHPIIYVDISSIRAGKLDEVKDAAAQLAAFIEANEPQLMAYQIFIDDDAEEMTVLAIHPDAASVELHMEIGGPSFARFADLLVLKRIDVFGEIGGPALEKLDAKARLLGTGVVRVHVGGEGFMHSLSVS